MLLCRVIVLLSFIATMGTVTFTRLYYTRNSCVFSWGYGWLSEITRCVPQQIKPLYDFSDKFIALQSACFCYYLSLCHKEQIASATSTTAPDGRRFSTALHFLWSDWMFAKHRQSTIVFQSRVVKWAVVRCVWNIAA